MFVRVNIYAIAGISSASSITNSITKYMFKRVEIKFKPGPDKSTNEPLPSPPVLYYARFPVQPGAHCRHVHDRYWQVP